MAGPCCPVDRARSSLCGTRPPSNATLESGAVAECRDEGFPDLLVDSSGRVSQVGY